MACRLVRDSMELQQTEDFYLLLHRVPWVRGIRIPGPLGVGCDSWRTGLRSSAAVSMSSRRRWVALPPQRRICQLGLPPSSSVHRTPPLTLGDLTVLMLLLQPRACGFSRFASQTRARINVSSQPEKA